MCVCVCTAVICLFDFQSNFARPLTLLPNTNALKSHSLQLRRTTAGPLHMLTHLLLIVAARAQRFVRFFFCLLASLSWVTQLGKHARILAS